MGRVTTNRGRWRLSFKQSPLYTSPLPPSKYERWIVWLDIGPLHFTWTYRRRKRKPETPTSPAKWAAHNRANEERWRRALEAEGARTTTTVPEGAQTTEGLPDG